MTAEPTRLDMTKAETAKLIIKYGGTDLAKAATAARIVNGELMVFFSTGAKEETAINLGRIAERPS